MTRQFENTFPCIECTSHTADRSLICPACKPSYANLNDNARDRPFGDDVCPTQREGEKA